MKILDYLFYVTAYFFTVKEPRSACTQDQIPLSGGLSMIIIALIGFISPELLTTVIVVGVIALVYGIIGLLYNQARMNEVLSRYKYKYYESNFRRTGGIISVLFMAVSFVMVIIMFLLKQGVI